MMETMRMLKPGEQAVITKITARGEFGRRIRDMGRAPLKDPVQIKLMGYMTLRNNEADHILVQPGG